MQEMVRVGLPSLYAELEDSIRETRLKIQETAGQSRETRLRAEALISLSSRSPEQHRASFRVIEGGRGV